LAYAPKLEIIHHAGRVHSNVDPLSRLPCAPPSQISPVEPKEPSIRTKETLDKRQEVTPAEKMAAFTFTFAAWSIEDCLDTPKEVMINVQSRNKRLGLETESLTGLNGVSGSKESVPNPDNRADTDNFTTLETSSKYWGAMNPPPTIHLSMSEEAKEEWNKSYRDDPMFRAIIGNDVYCEDFPAPRQCFLVDRDGMIFFNSENYQP